MNYLIQVHTSFYIHTHTILNFDYWVPCQPFKVETYATEAMLVASCIPKNGTGTPLLWNLGCFVSVFYLEDCI